MISKKIYIAIKISALIILLHINGFAQKGEIIGDSSQLDEGIIQVQPALVSGENYQANNAYTRSRIEDWLKFYNKKHQTHYQFLNNSIEYGKIVLITDSKAKLMLLRAQNHIPETQDKIHEILGNNLPYDLEYNYAMREMLFLEDQYYNVPVMPGKNFINTFGISVAKAATAWTFPQNELLNGKVSIKMFGDNSDEIKAQFSGRMVDGYADGYGLFACRDRDAILGYARKGFWKKGIFLQENEANDIADSLVYKILEGQPFQHLKVRVVEASFNKDPFFPNQTNGYTLIIKTTWNDGQNDRYFTINFSTSDFYNPPTISILRKDNFVQPPMLESANSTSFLNLLKFARQIVKEKYSGRTYNYDEYTKIYEAYPTNCNEKVETYQEWEDGSEHPYADNPNYTSGKVTKYEYSYDKCNTLNISIRDSRSSDWKQIGTIHTMQVFNGRASGQYKKYTTLVEPFMGHSFQPSVDLSYDDILKEIMPIVRSKYPMPFNDNSVEKTVKNSQQIFAEAKLEALKERIRNDPYFRFNPKDSLFGVWEITGGIPGALFIIDNSNHDSSNVEESFSITKFNSGKTFSLLTNNFKEGDPYQLASGHATVKKIQRRLQIIIPEGSKIAKYELPITELTRDYIKCTDKFIMKRIQ